MAIKMIMAVDKHYGIGYKNRLPWKCKEDMQFFKDQTDGLNNYVIMGRKTFESMGSKPLSNRSNIIVTSKLKNTKDNLPDVYYFPFNEVKEMLKNAMGDCFIEHEWFDCKYYKDIYVIGGKSLYEGLIDYVDEILVTNIKGDYETDVKIDPKIFEDFEIEKKEYLSNKATVIYYKRKEGE